MCGIGGEAGQDAVWIAVRKCVDLHGVVGARRYQLAILWSREHIGPNITCMMQSVTE